MATLDPFAASIPAARSMYGGHTTISSRVCPATCGKKSRKKSRVWSGVLYIFQLAAISFVLMRRPFQFEIEGPYLNDSVVQRRARMRANWQCQRAQNEF